MTLTAGLRHAFLQVQEVLQLEPGREAEGPAVLPILEGQRLIQALKQELAAGYVRRFGHSRPRSCVCAGVHC